MSERVAQIDRTVAKQLAATIEHLVRKELAKVGLTTNRTGNVRYSNHDLTIKLEVSTRTAVARKADGMKEAARKLGFPHNPIGALFNCPTPTGKTRVYEVVEINLRRPKYPIVARRLSNGKRFKFSASVVKDLLKGKD